MWKIVPYAIVQSILLAGGQVFLKLALTRMSTFAWTRAYWWSLLTNWQFAASAEVTVLDLPQQIKLMQQTIRHQPGAERILGYAINLLDAQTAFPIRADGLDAIWMSQFLDCFSMDEIVAILLRARQAMHQHTRLFIMETLWDRQKYETAAFCLTMTSLYFTALANGNSKMYHTEDLQCCVEKAGLEIERIYDHLGLGHSIIVCKVSN